MIEVEIGDGMYWTTTTTHDPKEELYLKKIRQLEEENYKLLGRIEKLKKDKEEPPSSRIDEDLLDLPELVISLAEIIAVGYNDKVDIPETVLYLKSLIKDIYPYESSSDHDSYDAEYTSDSQLLWLAIAFLSNIECPDEWADNDRHIGFNLYHAVKALDHYLDRPDARRK